MSDTQRYKGILFKLDRDETVTHEEHCKSLLQSMGREKASYHKNYEDAVNDELYDAFMTFDGEIYRIEYSKEDPYSDFVDMLDTKTGSIVFHTSFYDGGASLNEMLRKGLSKLK